MLQWLPYVLIPSGFGIAGVLVARAASAKQRGAVAFMPEPKGPRQEALRRAIAVAAVPDAWIRFLEQTSKREANFNPRAANRRDSEAAASLKMAERNKVKLNALGSSYEAWGFGSGGLFGQMPAAAAIKGGKYRFPKRFLANLGPNLVFNPGVSIAAALSYFDGLMKWKNFQGSWASLDAGSGNPSNMSKESKLRSHTEHMNERAEGLGWEPGWPMDTVPPLGRLTPARLEAIAGAANEVYS